MRKLLFFSVLLSVCLSCTKETHHIFIDGVDGADTEYTISGDENLRVVSVSCKEDFDVVVASNAQSWLTVKSKSRVSVKMLAAKNTSGSNRDGSVELQINGKKYAGFTIHQTTVFEKPELIYPAPQPASDRFMRMAYFPYYRDFRPSNFPDEMYDCLDVVFYAFARYNDNNVLEIRTSSHLPVVDLIKKVHDKGKKIVLSFGAWDDQRYNKMSIDPKARTAFVETIMGFVNQYGFDGVDNDWEYPKVADGSAEGNLYLMRELSNRLHAPGVNKTLSMAITSGRKENDNTAGLLPGVYDCCDWFCSMNYDSDAPHSPYDIVEKSYSYWVTKARMPLKKYIGGLPCYGRGEGYGSGGHWNDEHSYAELVKNYSADPYGDSVMTDGFLTNYNGINTITRKVQYYQSQGVGGYFFWEAGQDLYNDKSLIKIASSLVTGEPVTGSDPDPGTNPGTQEYTAVSAAGWTAGDKILVHDSSKQLEVELKADNISSEGDKALFDAQTLSVSNGYDGHMHAMSPASAWGAVTHGLYYYLYFNTSNAPCAIAFNEGNIFNFVPLCGKIKFTLTGDYDSFYVKGNSDETVLYSSFYVKHKYDNGGAYEIREKSGDAKKVEGTIKEGTGAVHILGSTALSAGITVILMKAGAVSGKYTCSEAITVEAGKTVDLGDISSGITSYTE